MKKKRLKWIVTLLFVCILFSGCDFRNYFYSEDSLKRIAESALEKKYGVEFVIYHAWDRSPTMFYADCSPVDDREIVFEAVVRKNGNGIVSDGYVMGILEQQIRDILQPDFEDVFTTSYQRSQFMYYSNVPDIERPQEIKLEEYLNTVDVDFVVYEVYVDLAQTSTGTLDKEYGCYQRPFRI